MGNVLLTSSLHDHCFVEVKKRPMLHYTNSETGAEVFLGRSGAGYYVEARHPDFPLPFRKSYDWFQRDLATRDFELLRAVVGGEREAQESATIAG